MFTDELITPENQTDKLPDNRGESAPVRPYVTGVTIGRAVGSAVINGILFPVEFLKGFLTGIVDAYYEE